MTEVEQKCSLAKRSELFEGLPSSVCTNILSSARPREFMCRDVMFFAGDPIREVVLLTDGRVKITQLSENGTEVILRLTFPGKVVSPLALVPGRTHSSTAIALQAGELLAWDAATFEAALERFPALRRNATSIMERRICEIEKRFCEISTGTASPRLANGVVRLLDQIGHKVNGHFEVNISQEVLAEMTAMTSFTASRVLTNWEQQGLVNLRREVIEVRNVPGLLKLCQVKRSLLSEC